MNKLELENKIQDANYKYWILNNPDISDVEYDKLIEELRKIDSDNSLLNTFNYQTTSKKIIHSKPMLSLDKAYSMNEILSWVKKYSRSPDEQLVIMPKYDGLSGKYENNKLSSRGDGKVGQDYTDRLPLITFQTNKTNFNTLLGEMLITNSDFNLIKNIKSKSNVPFKNQRNAAAGIIGCDDVNFYKNKAKITFVDYDLITFNTTTQNLEHDWDKIVNKIKQLNYPMDGIVIKLADKNYYEELGNTEHHPRGAIAFKFTNESKWTKLIGIEWTSGKQQICAVGQVDPIEINGTTIKNVKLQITKPLAVNTPYLLGNLQIGDYIEVERAGDIIPHVTNSKPGENRNPVKLDKCPFCNSDLIITNTSIKCSNEKCSEKIIQNLYFSINTLGYKGVGIEYTSNLYYLLNVDNVYKLLTTTKQQLKSHPEFGSKLVDNFLTQTSNILSNSNPVNILTALNLKSLTKNTAKLLLNNYPLQQIIKCNLTYEDLIKINGLGQTSASEIPSELTKYKNYVNNVFNLFTNLTTPTSKTTNLICFTGKMTYTRSEMTKIATELGYSYSDSVTKDTTLICADLNSNSSKLQKAKKLGCKIFTEQEFLNKYNKRD